MYKGADTLYDIDHNRLKNKQKEITDVFEAYLRNVANPRIQKARGKRHIMTTNEAPGSFSSHRMHEPDKVWTDISVDMGPGRAVPPRSNEVWDELSMLNRSYPGPCVFLGDFNQIDSLEDKWGEAHSYMGLMNLLSGDWKMDWLTYHFWVHGSPGPIIEKVMFLLWRISLIPFLMLISSTFLFWFLIMAVS